MSNGCRYGFCFGEYERRGGALGGGEGGLLARGGWMRGRDRIWAQAQAEFLLKSICNFILHQIIFVTLTRIEVVKNKTKTKNKT